MPQKMYLISQFNIKKTVNNFKFCANNLIKACYI